MVGLVQSKKDVAVVLRDRGVQQLKMRGDGHVFMQTDKSLPQHLFDMADSCDKISYTEVFLMVLTLRRGGS